MTAKQPTPPDPPKKRRRSAQEQALDILAKKRDALWTSHLKYHEREQVKFQDRVMAHEIATKAEIESIDAAIKALMATAKEEQADE